MKILVVDDDKVLLELFSDMLKSVGHEPICCQNPMLAMGEFLQNPFEIVLTDFQMPVWSGLSLALRIKGYCKAHKFKCHIICATGSDVNEVAKMNARDGSPISCILQKGSFTRLDLDNVIKGLIQ